MLLMMASAVSVALIGASGKANGLLQLCEGGCEGGMAVDVGSSNGLLDMLRAK